MWKSPVSKWATLAAMMRTIGGVAVAAFLPVYFQQCFPTFKNEYAVSNAIILSTCGFLSSIIGGIISDKCEKRSLMTKAYVCMIGNSIAFPLMAICCLQRNFWVSMVGLALKVLVSGSWNSPTITMM